MTPIDDSVISPAVTLVVTSCNRFDLLKRTLDSFFRHNSYPLEEVFIYEDSLAEVPEWATAYHDRTTVLGSDGNIGQLAAIDRLYARVRTPYVFHLEDDWEFYRGGFIEESLQVLEEEPNCINVWLLDRSDTHRHPVVGDRMDINWHGWHGYTWNPSLKRMADYHAVGSFAAVVATFPESAYLPPEKVFLKEAMVGTEYWRRGFYAKIARQGYMRHIGVGRHVGAV